MNVDVPRAVFLPLALACLCGLALLAAPLAPAVVGGPSTAVAATAQEDVDEDPPPHRNPDEYDEEGDADRIAAQLSEDLSERLIAAALSMSDGEYDAAREHVGDEYAELFDGYVEATGDSTGDGADGDGIGGAGADSGGAGADSGGAGAGGAGSGAGGGDGTGGVEMAPLERAAVDNAAFADALESFDENRTAYEEAVAADDELAAREYARNLSGDGAAIERLADRLAATYLALGDEVTVDDLDAADLEGVDEADLEDEEPFAAAADAVESTAANRSAELAVVRQEAFSETELTIRAGSPGAGPAEISFTEPLSATGELRTAAGAPVANERITLSIDGHRERVETDAAGRFDLDHRPTNQSASADALSVAYVPGPRSPYLGSETTVPVDVEPVEPTLSIREAPDEAAFGDSIRVSGDLAVDGVPVDAPTPVAITLDGERLGTATASNGTFEERVDVPASVAAGDVDLEAALTAEDRALRPTEAGTTVDVAETPTELTITEVSAVGSGDDGGGADDGGEAGDGGGRTVSVDGTALEVTDADLAGDEAAIALAGRLETADGTPVPNASLAVLADGSAVDAIAADGGGSDAAAAQTDDDAATGAIRSGADGSFSAIVAAPADAGELTVVYDDPGSNLGPAEATEPVGGGGVLAALPDPSPQLLGIGLAALAILAVGGWRLRSRLRDRRRDRDRIDDGALEPDAGYDRPPTSTAAGTEESDPVDEHPAPALLSAAADRLADGEPDDAVAAAYAAVRGLVEPPVDDGPLTHWEFYRRYEAAVDGAAVDGAAAGGAATDEAGGRGSDDLGADDPGADERDPAELRALTAAYERAVFAPDRVPADEADDVLDRARRLCDAVDDGRVGGTPADD